MSGTMAQLLRALDPAVTQGQPLPAPPEPKDSDTHLRWGLQVSVDDAVSENVPGAQGAHTTSDVGVASRKNRNLSPTQMFNTESQLQGPDPQVGLGTGA